MRGVGTSQRSHVVRLACPAEITARLSRKSLWPFDAVSWPTLLTAVVVPRGTTAAGRTHRTFSARLPGRLANRLRQLGPTRSV